MGVVRIDDKLLKEVEDFIDEDENKYKYPSVSAFINNAVYEKLTELRKDNKKE